KITPLSMMSAFSVGRYSVASVCASCRTRRNASCLRYGRRWTRNRRISTGLSSSVRMLGEHDCSRFSIRSGRIRLPGRRLAPGAVNAPRLRIARRTGRRLPVGGLDALRGEEITGQALKDFIPRDEVVLATKVFMRMRPGPSGAGLSRKAIFGEL